MLKNSEAMDNLSPLSSSSTLLTTDLIIAHEATHDSIGVGLQKTGFKGSMPCRKSEFCKKGVRCF